MSTSLIAHSADLSRLREEGYEVDVRGDHVVVTNVPYVNERKEVCHGTMVIPLTTSGDQTDQPPDHTVWFSGSLPCHHDGSPIERIQAGTNHHEIAPGLPVDHRFSSKPEAGHYNDYYDQFASYIRIISHEAQAIDPSATAATFAPVATAPEESVFRYHDSASSRAGIKMANAKLALPKIAIAGLGGTGSYVLDLVAKTEVRQIHLFDGDHLLNHNAFRAPAAVSLQRLAQRPLKVEHLAALYEPLRDGIEQHPYHLTADNAHEVSDMDFVFVCTEGGPDKRALVENLETFGIPFIDVGMGLHEQDATLGGTIRVTLSTPEQREHVRAMNRITFDEPDDEINQYARNIQVAELNALNACLAVIRWKKLFGFYADLEGEHNSLYTVEDNFLVNEDHA